MQDLTRVWQDSTGRRIGPVLAQWRHDLRWTQAEVAHRAGISRGYVSRLERGVPERPGIDVLNRICAAMGRTWPELFQSAGVALPGDVTLDDIGRGIDDPELALYLTRLPELNARDRAVLRTLLRAFFEHQEDESAPTAPASHQLALPGGIR